MQKLMRKSTNATAMVAVRHDQSREVDFANKIGIVDEAIGCFGQARRKEGPGQHPSKNHQRVRRGSVGWQLGDASEN